nr:MAG TPA: hypothetical protein [Caudoviricetes sp.]
MSFKHYVGAAPTSLAWKANVLAVIRIVQDIYSLIK